MRVHNTCVTSSLPVCCVFAAWWQPINQLSGQANHHSILAVLYAVVNFHHSTRLSTHAIQVATIVNDHDAKLASMDEVINGGTTSLGAQLRRLDTPTLVKDPFRTLMPDTGDAAPTRPMTVHAIAVAGDFPAMASMGPWKGSVSAHCYDRKSTLDQRSDEYGKPFSMLAPRPQQGDFQSFRRLTLRDIIDCVDEAAATSTKAEKEEILGNMGMNWESFVFHDNGKWEFNFALARLPYLDWLNGNSHDAMHTSILGTITQEIGYSQYMFITVRGYYTRLEINSAKLAYKGLPPGTSIPDFGKYITEGEEGKRPKNRAKLSAGQARAWLEHGTSIMELRFRQNVRAARQHAM